MEQVHLAGLGPLEDVSHRPRPPGQEIEREVVVPFSRRERLEQEPVVDGQVRDHDCQGTEPPFTASCQRAVSQPLVAL